MAIKIQGNTVIDDSRNWTGSAIPVSKGGSGATTLSGVLIGNGTSSFTTKTNPTGDFVGTTDTQTLTNKTFDDNLNVVGSYIWDGTKSVRIINYGQYHDPGSWTTTASAAYTSQITVIPTRTNTKLHGYLGLYISAAIDGNTSGDAGNYVYVHWYNGTAYVTDSFNYAGTIQTSGGLSGGTNRAAGTIQFELTSSQRRTDTGDWFLRAYMTRTYTGNSILVNNAVWTWWEIEK